MNHSFDKDIAVAYGLPEAIILNHIQFWIEQNEANKLNYYDGSYWTYNTTKAFAEIFPYLSQRQMKEYSKPEIITNLPMIAHCGMHLPKKVFPLCKNVKWNIPKCQMDLTHRCNLYQIITQI